MSHTMRRIPSLRSLVHRFHRDQDGATAIEFALVALPLFMTIFVILECAIQYFVWTSLDLAVHRAARQIRVGHVQEQSLDRETFKAAVCGQINNFFGCRERLRLTVDVVKNLPSASTRSSFVDGSALAIEETFDAGKSGDFLIIQAYFPWPSFSRLASLGTPKTSDGNYVLHTATLFRNEPF